MSVGVIGEKWSVEADGLCEGGQCLIAAAQLSQRRSPHLLQLITVDSAPIIRHCSQRLTSSFETSWVKASDEDAGVLACAIVRLATSYVSMPPEADHDVADDLARLMTPFAERCGVIEKS